MKTQYFNAGAGSGKTYTLTHMLADMLSPDSCIELKTIDPSRIILTTFTKAAAADFVKKAREVLINEKHNPAKAAELDSALIGTVHSVCETFVKKYWYRLGLSLPLNLIPGEDKKLYISRTAENVASDDDVKYFTKFALDHEMNPDFWKDYLKGIVEMKFNFGVDGLAESCETSCRDIATIFTADATDKEDVLNDFLSTIVNSIERMNHDLAAQGKEPKLVAELKEAKGLLNAPVFKKAVKVYNWSTAGVEKKRGFWKDTFDTDAYASAIDAATCSLLSKSIGIECQTCVRRLFALAENWEQVYRKFKEENSLLDFNDLEQKFLQILYDDGFEDVRQDILNSYDLMMVDEFQDSNPVQIRIFRKMMELVGETVFVGDRKQAIFGFRGTETSLVDGFIADIAEKDKKTLAWSFRSRPELVETANDVFCKAFDGSSLKPHRSPCNGQESALQHWNIPIKSKEGYAAVGKKILDLVSSGTFMVVKKDKDGNEFLKAIQYGDIAILLRNAKYHINDVVQSLRDAGVPVSVQEDNFMEWAEAQLIVSLIRYIIDEKDRCAKADILHLIGGIAPEALVKAILSNQPSEAEEKLFKQLEVIRSRISVLSVSEIVESLALELDMYTHVANWGRSETRSRNIGFMVGLARQYEQQCETMNASPTLPGYLAYVTGFKPESHPVDKTNTVKVLTCHNAKGLEWPMVILDQLDSLDLSDQSFYKKEFSGVHNYRDTTGGDVLLHVLPAFFSKDTGYGNNTKLPQPVMDRMTQTDYYNYLRKRKIDEESRLLYVAFTRAQDYLVTLGNEKSDYSWPRLCNAADKGKQPGNSLLWHPEHPSDCLDLLPPTASGDEQRPLHAWTIPVEANASDKYKSPSLSNWHGLKSISESLILTQVFRGEKMLQRIQSKDNESAVCGTCIHRIFAAYDPAEDRMEMIKMAGRIIEGMNLTKEFPSPESVVNSATQLFGWLKEEYGKGAALHELPVVMKQPDGTIIRGEMDLVWDLPGSKCVLVDYKSFHGSENLGAIKAHADQHGYPEQLKAYKDTLEAGDYEVLDVLIYYFVQGQVIRFKV